MKNSSDPSTVYDDSVNFNRFRPMRWGAVYFAGSSLAALLLWSCHSQRSYVKSKEQTDAIITRLMQVEQPPVGQYNTLARFHSELMNEVFSPDSMPYPQLGELFHAMQQNALEVSGNRVNFASEVRHLFGEDRASKRVSQPELSALCERGNSILLSSQKVAMAVDSLHAEYTQLCDSHHIRRIQTIAYGDTIDAFIEMYGDSLEAQGRSIALAKKDLYARFPSKNTQFWDAYNIISGMEANMKLYQNSLHQLETVQSRMYSANGEDYFFKGPYIRARVDIQAAEDLIVHLFLEMRDFRNSEIEYYRK